MSRSKGSRWVISLCKAGDAGSTSQGCVGERLGKRHHLVASLSYTLYTARQKRTLLGQMTQVRPKSVRPILLLAPVPVRVQGPMGEAGWMIGPGESFDVTRSS